MPAAVLSYKDRNAVVCRPYTYGDIPKIVETVVREVPNLPHYRGIKVDPARVQFLLENSVGKETDFMARVLCDSHGEVVGGIAAYCVTQLLSWDKVTGDVFLYIEPGEHRSIINALKLIREYAYWGKAQGASIIQATHTAGYRGDAMNWLLSRAGFEKVGTLFHYRGEL
jgi:hypothetical protein